MPIPFDQRPTPPATGIVKDNVTGGMMTVANAATNERIQPREPKQGFVMPGWLAGLLGVLALACGIPAAILVALPATVTAPAWLPVAAAVGGVLTPFLTGLAFWAQGGNPLDALKAFAPKPPPTSNPRVGPPEP